VSWSRTLPTPAGHTKGTLHAGIDLDDRRQPFEAKPARNPLL
jgi:hypothetical protein